MWIITLRVPGEGVDSHHLWPSGIEHDIDQAEGREAKNVASFRRSALLSLRFPIPPHLRFRALFDKRTPPGV
jgi:hypothetical protein